MSTIKNPVGPESRRVYARRRLVVLLGLVAVIAVIVLIIVRPGAGDAKPVAAPTPDASAGVETPAVEPCAPGAVVVLPVVDKTSYQEGENPQLSMTISNSGTTPCTVNAGTSQMVLTVMSGDEVYWTSTDCQTAAQDTEVTFEPSDPKKTAPISWDRTRSAPDTCDLPDRESVPAGGATYRLTVSLGGVETKTPSPFMLF
ncbi:hypothetical protein [Lysinibacter cavernae]|uniref:DUF4232 domain-containing protein n=1 Tax=Lysinibacter cavernae TaxID=1640652 RepID=A0A7X5R2M7_9MICO|nr:hypothetical protein [Lysinibacter cavernae]NIH54260.1 hypothetical protein [Lysinibacter cavernae]